MLLVEDVTVKTFLPTSMVDIEKGVLSSHYLFSYI